MDIETLRAYVLSLDDVEETFPFGDNILVFKTNAKAFLLVPLDTEQLRFNVKCEPDYAIELREQYSSILPGFHMNKKHWNTVIIDGTLTNDQLKQFILDSYELIKKRHK